MAGVSLAAGGSFDNQVGGVVVGGQFGADVVAGSVTNAGGIYSSLGVGVRLQNGGSLTNAAGATSYGYQGGVLGERRRSPRF